MFSHDWRLPENLHHKYSAINALWGHHRASRPLRMKNSFPPSNLDRQVPHGPQGRWVKNLASFLDGPHSTFAFFLLEPSRLTHLNQTQCEESILDFFPQIKLLSKFCESFQIQFWIFDGFTDAILFWHPSCKLFFSTKMFTSILPFLLKT